jgi:hypothetical protein
MAVPQKRELYKEIEEAVSENNGQKCQNDCRREMPKRVPRKMPKRVPRKTVITNAVQTCNPTIELAVSVCQNESHFLYYS